MVLILMLVQAAASADAQGDRRRDIVVTGRRLPPAAIGDEPPVLTISRKDVESLGVDSIGDAIDTARGSAPGGAKEPFLLLNGKRIAGLDAVRALPAEAIERLEIFAGQEAVRHGYQDGRTVMNIVTVAKYRAAKLTQSYGGSTDGGGKAAQSGISYTRIAGTNIINLAANYQLSSSIRESERRATTGSQSSLFNTIGNVVSAEGGSIDPALDALIGRQVAIAGVPGAAPTLAGFVPLVGGRAGDLTLSGRTLRPKTQKIDVTGTMATSLFETVAALFTIGVKNLRERGSRGYASAVFPIPSTSPFSPFDGDVLLYRYLDEVPDLRQSSGTTNVQLGMTLNGKLGRWNWSDTSEYTRNHTTSSVDLGVSTDAATAAIAQGTIDPFAKIPAGYLADRVRSVSRSFDSSVSTSANMYGRLARLPSGDLTTVINASAASSRLHSTSSDSVGGNFTIRRDTIDTSINVDLPFASATDGVLTFLNRASINLNAGVAYVSRFGRMPSYGVGLGWNPSDRGFVNFVNVSLGEQKTAPSAAQLAAPSLTLPNVPSFDVTRGVTTSATVISGGNPSLLAERRRSLSALVALMPFRGVQASVQYTAEQIRDPIRSLPTATPAVEAAFPERFVRGSDGSLTEIDSRPINLGEEDEQRLEGNIFFSRSIGKPQPLSAGASVGAQSTDAAEPSGQMTIRLNHSIRLRDNLVIRKGLPALNLLSGDLVDAIGSRPRHETTFEVNRNAEGIGTTLGMHWQSATQAKTADGDRLKVSDLLKLNIKLFVSFDKLPAFHSAIWARGLRLTIAVDNLLDRRIKLTDEHGALVPSYNPAYVDPVGRSVNLSLRKIF